MRELYFYWRARRDSLAPALAAAHGLQRRGRERFPGLDARLLRRAEGDAETLMEIYTCPGGIDDERRGWLQAEGDRALAPWLDGPRHLEVFAPAEC
jgi:hypothetical protein